MSAAKATNKKNAPKYDRIIAQNDDKINVLKVA